MEESSNPSIEDNFHELEILRSIIHRNIDRLNQDPILTRQLEFWMESAQFTAATLEIWQDAKDTSKYNRAMEKMEKILRILQKLIEKLDDGSKEETS